MRKLIVAAIVLLALVVLLAACRGEPVPRDYQNAPPDMKQPPQSQSATPSAGATGEAPPQPTTGVEGPNPARQPVAPPAQPTTTTLPDTPPVTTTT